MCRESGKLRRAVCIRIRQAAGHSVQLLRMYRNAHHLRELEFIGKQYEQAWAEDMADLLLEIKAKVEKLKPDRDGFGPEEVGNFERRYDEIIRRGFADSPFTPPKEKTGER